MPLYCCRLLPLALLLAALTAQADWRHIAIGDADVSTQAFRYQFDRSGRLWSFSGDGVRRFDAQGRPTLLRRSDNLPQAQPLGENITGARLLADGSALLTTEVQAGADLFCNVQRLDAQGRATWRVPGQARYWACASALSSNDAGDAWITHGEALRAVDRDGRYGVQVRAGSANERALFGRSTVVLDDASIIATWHNVDLSSSVTTARLSRYGRDGAIAWTWRHDATALVEHLLALPGGATIGALNAYDNASGSAVIRWNADGSEAWRLPAAPPSSSVAALLAAAQGDHYAVLGGASGSTGPGRVLRVSASGQLRWQRDLDCAVSSHDNEVIAVSGDDGLALACAGRDGGNAQLLRISRDGGTTTAMALPLRAVMQLLRQPDGKLLLLGGETPGLERRRSYVIDGNSIQPAAFDSLRGTAPTSLLDSLLAADGNSYLSLFELRDTGWPQPVLRAIDSQGRQRWTQAMAERSTITAGTLSASASRVCVIGTELGASQQQATVQCRAAGDGRLLWQAALPTTQGLATRLFDDGSVVAVSIGGGRFDIRRFAADGSVRGSSGGESGNSGAGAAIDAFGRVTVFTERSLSQFDAEGNRRYHLEGAALPLQLNAFDIDGAWQRPELIAADDGSVWIAAPAVGEWINKRSVWAVAGNGGTRWVRAVEEKPGLKLAASSSAVYVAQWGEYRHGSGAEIRAENFVTALGKSDGAQRWRHVSVDPLLPGSSNSQRPDPRTSPALTLSTDGSSLLLAHGWNDRLRLQRLDTASGQLLHERFVACTSNCSAPQALAADRDNRLRLSADAFDRDAGSGALVLALDGAAAAQPAIRLAQAGIGGAWWSPYANGEGIVFDWLPDSRTLFGAWFTYAEEPDNDPAGLRWYTLQANGVATDARRLELPILRTGGGNFAAAPAVTPQRVGTATLEFHDCTNGSLHYQFDAAHNGGRRGTVTLSRLSPATAPCILADGSTQPGAGARPPQQGFDARMAGTWFDPAIPGQGLQFTVQPGGVFFAPWFTFDPAGSGNDASRQHWFTLQGDLAQASGGAVDLQLIQTTGGAFDRVPTSNAQVVGSTQLQMLACDRARLNYRFGSSNGVAAFAGLSGSLTLEKAGGCTAP